MYLTAYHFRGDPAELTRGHAQLLSALPAEDVQLHIVVATEHSITVLDACPSRAVFEEFSTSRTFLTAIADAGLPSPTIEPLGEVAQAIVRPTEGAR